MTLLSKQMHVASTHGQGHGFFFRLFFKHGLMKTELHHIE